MTIAWILYVLFVGTLLTGAALAIDGVMRRTSLPTRWVWVGALAAIACLSMIAPRQGAISPPPEMQSARDDAAIVAAAAVPSTGFLRTMERMRDGISSSVAAGIAAAETRVPSAVMVPLAIAWGLWSAALLAVVLIVNRRVHRARRAWPVADVHGIAVRIAPSMGPAVVGLSSPEIVVPRWLFERSRDEQRLVVVHEREHIAARDQLLPIGGWLIAALLPWHPAVWWSLSRLRLAIELDCDARVLNHGVQPRPYGALLIDIASHCATHRVGALALADQPSHLERRLLAMKQTRPRFVFARTSVLGALAAIAIVMACEARLPTSAEIASMDVESLEKAALQAKILDERAGKQVIYKVDGRTVSAEEAHAISEKRIVSLNVTKEGAEAGNGDGQVFTFVNVKTSDGKPKIEPVEVYLKSQTNDAALEAAHGTLKARTGFTGLLFVDGVRAPASALSKLTPHDIATINILKAEAATEFSSDPAAANGIIKVFTKRGAAAAAHDR
jgi:beta-lactamase regulating signal transducer with metallopeptidase domain